MGSLTVAPDGVTPAERLSLDPKLVPTLLAVAPGETIRLAAWPRLLWVWRVAVISIFRPGGIGWPKL